MTFQDRLNDYILQARCSSKELSAASSLSEGTISRYRRGHRVPGANSHHLRKLADGLEQLLAKRGIVVVEDSVYEELRKTVDTGVKVDYETFVGKLKRLLRLFKISNNELGRRLNYDPSYISRILSGQRRPADIAKFSSSVAAYIAYQKSDEYMPADLEMFLGCASEAVVTPEGMRKVITEWLLAS